MDSQRFPGKVMADLNGRPVLAHVLDRVKLMRSEEIVIATSSRKIDDPIKDFGNSRNVQVYRGSAKNVLKRAIKCAEYYFADCILRVCGDSPFISHKLANNAIEIMNKKKPDIVTTNFPRTWPIGSSVEIITIQTLKKIGLKVNKIEEREHILKFAYLNPHHFKIINIYNKSENQCDIRLAVDTKEDLIRNDWILKNIDNTFDDYKLDEIVDKYLKYKNLKDI